MKVLLSVLVFVLMATTASAASVCTTRTLPGSPTGFVTLPPGQSNVVFYIPPGGSAGLEFWSHRFPGAPIAHETIRLSMAHLFLSTGQFVVTSIMNNAGTDRGQYHNFALSTFVNPGEAWVVTGENLNPFPVQVFLIITARECTGA